MAEMFRQLTRASLQCHEMAKLLRSAIITRREFNFRSCLLVVSHPSGIIPQSEIEDSSLRPVTGVFESFPSPVSRVVNSDRQRFLNTLLNTLAGRQREIQALDKG